MNGNLRIGRVQLSKTTLPRKQKHGNEGSAVTLWLLGGLVANCISPFPLSACACAQARLIPNPGTKRMVHGTRHKGIWQGLADTEQHDQHDYRPCPLWRVLTGGRGIFIRVVVPYVRVK